MNAAPGTRLGIYEIVAPIGEGGMGKVYRATDTTLGRQVAIKILPDAFAADPERMARFEREAKTLASLNHPSIAAVYGFEKSGGASALVMELVEGEDLSQRIARGAIPLDEALPIAKQIAEALEAAHEQGIIHRDLKPANIKVRPDGAVKVLDFGLAKAMDQPSGSGLQAPGTASMSPTITTPAMTQAGVILGTAAYMSPEQAKGRAADRRADVWAFGAVLYEMLTRQRAFGGEDVSDTLANVLKLEPDWDRLPGDVPSRVRQVLHACLQKNVKQRIGDMQDVRLALAGAFEEDGPRAASTARAVRRRPAREYLAWGMATLATILAIGASSLYVRALRQAGAIVRFTVAPPRGAARLVQAPFAVSPDGQSLAFIARASDSVFRIFVRRLDSTDAQPLAGTEAATVPFWSPDGRSLGFAKGGGLYRTNVDGSVPLRLCDVPGGAGRNALAGSWSSRGVIVFASISGGLWQVPDTGGTPMPVTTIDPANKEALHTAPWFLPDGRHLLFLALAAGSSRGVIWAASIDSPARTRVTESSGGAAYADGWLLTTTAPPRVVVAQPFDPDRLTLAGAPQPVRDRLAAGTTNGPPGFSVSLNGALVVDRPPPVVHQLTWVDRVGRVVETIGPEGVIRDFALAPDGQRVAASVTDVDSLANDLWLFDPQHREGTRLTFQAGLVVIPMWDLDGRRVYFSSTANDLRVLALGSTESKPFENPGGFSRFNDITRDGRYLVFMTSYPLPEIWIQRVGAPTERRAQVKSRFVAAQARVSPDGRWLAYTLVLPKGPDVFVQPFDRPGDPIQVSRGDGIGAIWRADSRELYYEAKDGLMAVALADRGGALDVGTPQRLFSLHTQGFVTSQPHNVEVAANGQKFLVNTIVGDSENVPLEVTLNWTTGFKK